MTIADFTPVSALLGGALIGVAAAGLWWLIGRLAGVSSIFGGVVIPLKGEVAWRAAFLAGLLVSGLLAVALVPSQVDFSQPAGYGQLLLAGTLVGIGTKAGGGCTSGHGVCGIGRLSPRSIVATLLFMAAAMVSVCLWKAGP